jgi:hypothetical protein
MDYEKILDDLYADMEANPTPPSPVGSRLVPGGKTHTTKPDAGWMNFKSTTKSFFDGDGDWERATVLPRAVNRKTGERSWAFPELVTEPVRGVWGMMKAPYEIQRALSTPATEDNPNPLGRVQRQLAVDTFNAGLGQTALMLAGAGKSALAPSSTASSLGAGPSRYTTKTLERLNDRPTMKPQFLEDQLRRQDVSAGERDLLTVAMREPGVIDEKGMVNREALQKALDTIALNLNKVPELNNQYGSHGFGRVGLEGGTTYLYRGQLRHGSSTHFDDATYAHVRTSEVTKSPHDGWLGEIFGSWTRYDGRVAKPGEYGNPYNDMKEAADLAKSPDEPISHTFYRIASISSGNETRFEQTAKFADAARNMEKMVEGLSRARPEYAEMLKDPSTITSLTWRQAMEVAGARGDPLKQRFVGELQSDVFQKADKWNVFDNIRTQANAPDIDIRAWRERAADESNDYRNIYESLPDKDVERL